MNNNYTVYAHINKINGKMYIGLTSKSVDERWRNGKGYKKSYFNNAIKKYGWDNFEHEVIASNLSEKDAKNFEILLIDKLQTNNSNFGYNLTKGGDGLKGFIPSKETREKMSLAKKGVFDGENNPMYGISPKERMDKDTYNQWLEKHKQTGIGSNNPNSKKIVCITTNEIFNCIKDASEKYNIHASDITTCCKGKLKSAGKHPITDNPMQWQYYEQYLNGIKINEYTNTRIKKIICITTNEIFNSIKEASIKYNINASNITLCCQHKYSKAGKHPETKEPMIWMYYEEYKQII